MIFIEALPFILHNVELQGQTSEKPKDKRTAFMRLNLTDLHLFLCITDAGSITQGAIKANLALSSASERLRHLEDDVGVALLTRHARGVQPTAAGRVLMQHARKILEQHQRLKQELHDFSIGMRGTITLYANTSALTHFLLSKIAPWLKNHPAIQLECIERNSVDIVAGLKAGQIEAGIISDAVAIQNLILDPIMKDHLVVIVPPQHIFISKKAVFLSDLVHESFVGLTLNSALQTHLQTQAQHLGTQLHFRIHMNSFEGLCEMVSNGVGIAILPEVIADQYQAKFAYQKLTLLDAWAKRQLCLCYTSWETLSPAMKILLQDLKRSHAPK